MIVTRIKWMKLVAAALASAVLQQSLMHRFSYGYISLDLIALLAAFVAVSVTNKSAPWTIAALGLLRDLGSTGRPGLGALSFLVALIPVWKLKERLDRTTAVSEPVLSFLFLLCEGFVYAAGTLLLTPGMTLSLFYHSAGRAVFSAFMAPPLFSLFRTAGITETKKTVF